MQYFFNEFNIATAGCVLLWVGVGGVGGQTIKNIFLTLVLFSHSVYVCRGL